MAKKSKLTSEQKQLLNKQQVIEKKVSEWVDQGISKEISEDEAETLITSLIEKAFQEGIYSQQDHNSLLVRRDRGNPRGYYVFFRDIKLAHEKEEKIFFNFLKYLRKKGHKVKWKRNGSDGKGKPIIGGFGLQEKKASPSSPDYSITIGEKTTHVEVKCFKANHLLKTNCLSRYKDIDNIILIAARENDLNDIVVYFKRAIEYMSKYCPPSTMMGGNSIVNIGINPNHKSTSTNLKELHEKGLIYFLYPERQG